MPRPNKALTREYRLRTTDDEQAAVDRIRIRAAETGTTMSQNDAVRLLIRWGATPPFPDRATALASVTRHTELCAACSADRIGCPDGMMLQERASLAPAPPPRRPRRVLPPPPGAQR
ncbi:hypothetical protein ACFRCW_42345 [Streptomyces sp. NPDC056653]|uniref:hypothetical protein n=1 Tax=Streptomyces sp. NPDC056653 TaxID=3345894 RepID=UPI003693B6B8